MGKGKGYRLEKGFLVDYGWVPSLKRLPGEEFKALVLALLSYQQSGGKEALPDWGENAVMSCIAEMILPQLRNRLLGAVHQAAGKEKEQAAAVKGAEEGAAKAAAAKVAPRAAEVRVCAAPREEAPLLAAPVEVANAPVAFVAEAGESPADKAPLAFADASTVTPPVTSTVTSSALPEPEPEPEPSHAYDTLAAWGLLKEEGDDFWAEVKPRGQYDAARRTGFRRR